MRSVTQMIFLNVILEDQEGLLSIVRLFYLPAVDCGRFLVLFLALCMSGFQPVASSLRLCASPATCACEGGPAGDSREK